MEHIILFNAGLAVLAFLIVPIDLKDHVIRNTHLLGACFYGILIYVYLAVLRHEKIDAVPIFLNLCVSFSIAYLLYAKNLWSAGDAKLFIVLSFLMPPGNYPFTFNLSALALFANIFIVALLYFFIFDFKNILKNVRNLSRTSLKQYVSGFLYSFLLLVSFSWLIKDFLFSLGLRHPLFNLVLLYVTLFFLRKFLHPRPLFFLVLVFSGLALSFWLKGASSFSSGLIDYLIRMLIYTVFFNILDIAFNVSSSSDSSFFLPLVPRNIAFAPIMFLGAFFVQTPLLLDLIKLRSYVF